MSGIRYNELSRAEFGDVELEFRIGVNQGFRELNPLLPEDQGISLTGGSLAQDIFDITEVNTSLKQVNFALTEGESVQLYLGLFDPTREQFLSFSQIDNLTTLDIDHPDFAMDLQITGFRGDSELIAGDVALLSDREIEAGARDDITEFRSENEVLGQPFRTTFRTSGEFALEKQAATDLQAGITEGDYLGSIVSLSSGVNQFTPIDGFPETGFFGPNESVSGIPSVSIQTVHDGDDPGSSLIAPNANTAEELQAIRLELEVTYRLNQNDQVFNDLVRGDFNYIDLAAEATIAPPPVDVDDPTPPPSGDSFFGGTAGPDRLNGGDGDQTIIGLGGADTIRGGAGDDQLSGNGGRDKLLGQAGNDDLFGDGGRDTLKGGGGRDFAAGGGGKDVVIGGGGADELFGERGADVVRGGGGDDLIAGEQGNDQLTGNGGADTFMFFGLKGRNTVTDFRATQDKLLFAAGGDLDDLAFRQIGNTLQVTYDRAIILLRNTDQDDFDRADVDFVDLF